MCRLKNLRKIVIPLWRSGRRVEATSSPGWRSRRRASRPNFCSGHLYVGSSNSACPAHPPKSNSQPSPPTRKPTLSTVRPSLSRSSPSVLAEAQPSSPGVTPKPPFPRSPRPSHRPVTRAPRPHGCSHPSHPTPSWHRLCLPQSSSGHSPWSSLALHSLESIPSSAAKWPYQTQTG